MEIVVKIHFYPGTNDENTGPAKSNDDDDSTTEAKNSEDDEANDYEEDGEGVVEIKMNLQDVLANSTLKEEHLTQGKNSTG